MRVVDEDDDARVPGRGGLIAAVFPAFLFRPGFGHTRQSSVKDDSPKCTDSERPAASAARAATR